MKPPESAFDNDSWSLLATWGFVDDFPGLEGQGGPRGIICSLNLPSVGSENDGRW